MAAIPISGRNGEALTGAVTDARHILEDGNGNAPNFASDGRVFELLHLVVENSADSSTPAARLTLWDSNEGSAPATTAQIGGHYVVPGNSTLEKTWERGTGPRFRTNVTATTSPSTTLGTVAVRAVYAAGVLH